MIEAVKVQSRNLDDAAAVLTELNRLRAIDRTDLPRDERHRLDDAVCRLDRIHRVLVKQEQHRTG